MARWYIAKMPAVITAPWIRLSDSSGQVNRVVELVRGGFCSTFASAGSFYAYSPSDATATADTGDFVLENLPEGSVRLAFFLQGFGAESRDVAARGGEESRVSTTTLKPTTEASTPATVTGVVRLDDGKPLANARLRFVSPTSSFIVTTDANGAFCFIPPVCGDGQCDFATEQTSCPQDCNTQAECGDGVCDQPIERSGSKLGTMARSFSTMASRICVVVMVFIDPPAGTRSRRTGSPGWPAAPSPRSCRARRRPASSRRR